MVVHVSNVVMMMYHSVLEDVEVSGFRHSMLLGGLGRADKIVTVMGSIQDGSSDIARRLTRCVKLLSWMLLLSQSYSYTSCFIVEYFLDLLLVMLDLLRDRHLRIRCFWLLNSWVSYRLINCRNCFSVSILIFFCILCLVSPWLRGVQRGELCLRGRVLLVRLLCLLQIDLVRLLIFL